MSVTQILGLILFIVCMLAAAGCYSFGIYKSVLLVKDKRVEKPYEKTTKLLAILTLVASVTFTAGLLFIYLWNSYSPKAWQVLAAIFGGLIFGLSFSGGTFSFIVHYYCKNIPEKLDKKLFIYLMVSIPCSIIFFILATNGFADMQGEGFLLPNGLNFTYGFVNAYDASMGKGPNIAFYAICILAGAVFVYFLADHKMYRLYGKHNLLESTFLIALPAGIIGARIAYVIGEWNTRFAHEPWWKVFAIWEGGLTILGGAIAGIIVGVLWFKWRHKEISIWPVVDICVPVILIAQAIGRWGNFFNCEVHGIQMAEEYWNWVPRIVFNQAHFSSTKGWSDSGMLYVPLFFIEAIINILGYCVLAHLFGDALKKYTKPGDLAFGYLIWYGATRVFMEPLRDASFNMGEKGFWSWFWSLIFVVAGALCIFGNHLIRYIIDYKKNRVEKTTLKSHIPFTSVMIVIGLFLFIFGLVMMVNNPTAPSMGWSNYNIGLICLIFGIASILLSGIGITGIVQSFRQPKDIENA